MPFNRFKSEKKKQKKATKVRPPRLVSYIGNNCDLTPVI